MNYNITILENGLKIIRHDIPYMKTITSSLWINQGSQNETKDNNGISHLLEHLLFDLTRNDETECIMNELNNCGAKYNAATTKEFMYFSVTTMNSIEKFKLGLNTLSQMVRQPFSKESFNKEKKIVLNEIKTHLNHKNRVINNCFYALWDEHSIGLSVLGKEENINKFTFEEMEKLKKEKVNPGNAFLVILGNLNLNTNIIDIINEYFSDWRDYNIDCLFKDEIVVKNGPRIITKEGDNQNAAFTLAFNGVKFNNSYARVLELSSVLLTSGVCSRLYQKLRTEKKLLYSIQSSNYSFNYAGAFTVCMLFNSENFEEIIRGTLKELNRLKVELISEKELNQCKSKFITKLSVQLENPNSLLLFISRYFTLGKIYSYYEHIRQIQSIKPKDIYTIFNEIFILDNVAFSSIGDINQQLLIQLLENDL